MLFYCWLISLHKKKYIDDTQVSFGLDRRQNASQLSPTLDAYSLGCFHALGNRPGCRWRFRWRHLAHDLSETETIDTHRTEEVRLIGANQGIKPRFGFCCLMLGNMMRQQEFDCSITFCKDSAGFRDKGECVQRLAARRNPC